MDQPVGARRTLTLQRWFEGYRRVVRPACLLVLILTLAGWVLFVWFGRTAIEAAHLSDAAWPANLLPGGGASTPVDVHHEAAAQFVWTSALKVVGAIGIAAGMLLLPFLIRNAVNLALALASGFLTSVVVFVALELVPALIRPLGLDAIEYYAWRSYSLPDDALVHRGRPNVSLTRHDFRGSEYSPIHGIEVTPETVEWRTDENGFRNSRPTTSADVVMVGDSYLEFGSTEQGTLPSRLEARLQGGLTVAQFGKAGWGPFQYVEAFKRYAIETRPRYALFAFYEGNDVADTRTYVEYLDGRGVYATRYMMLSSGNPVRRYGMAAASALESLRRGGASSADLLFHGIHGIRHSESFVDAPIALLDLGDRTHMVRFFDYADGRTAAEVAGTEEWMELRGLLAEFIELARANDIEPIVLYIPTAAHIYAEYSAESSGRIWLGRLPRQMAGKESTEAAMTTLASDLDVEMISLSPAFEEAAREGRALFHQLDSHWNAAGIEVAADLVARRINDRANQ